MLLSVVCTTLAATLPFNASAASPQVQLTSETNLTLAQYRRNDRQFSVYYRNRGAQQWNLENTYANRQQAQRAARRLERRGYNTYVQLSREVGRRYG
ncbi:hypothetical protein [Chamaesiphon sp.]|uniref:hypothetical protein n=1 Tax=Chamaesiphon sp. TaxID=2814140 RepID=UPI003592E85D